jgi:hypothetical protein
MEERTTKKPAAQITAPRAQWKRDDYGLVPGFWTE